MSIYEGTQVQEVKGQIRQIQEDAERRIAEIVGTQATGQGWDAPGFEEIGNLIRGPFANVFREISEFAANRVVDRIQRDIDAK